MLVVIDTNELLKMAAAYKTSPLFVAWREGRFHLALSNEILKEMMEVAAQAQFIVTCDDDLHDAALADRLRDEYGIRVVWPGEFLEATRL